MQSAFVTRRAETGGAHALEEGIMRPRTLYRVTTLAGALAVALSACSDLPTSSDVGDPSLKKGGGGGKASLSVSMAGDFTGEDQVMSGKNDQSTLTVKGDYTLTLALDLVNLECGDLPGSIPDEAGLVAFVQGQTPQVGSLDVQYDKTDPSPSTRVDSWKTTIGRYSYRVQFFRWGTSDFTDGPDGTVVSYRGGSIEVFKMKGGRYISREQCFGDFVDYDLTVR